SLRAGYLTTNGIALSKNSNTYPFALKLVEGLRANTDTLSQKGWSHADFATYFICSRDYSPITRAVQRRRRPAGLARRAEGLGLQRLPWLRR
ncbi:MAG TPA: hypothetical protein VLD83_16330, partial [Candidatus Binatia bacterium]|nr:hypothetical protein [Candidatus Binatia bacterium]